MMSGFGIRQIQQLGKKLAEELGRRRFTADEFATLAQQRLLETSQIDPVALTEIAAFLCSDEAPEQSASSFSDVPLIVFRHPDFYIEVLHWMHATTTVHAHSFAGAFRVLCGSSIHTPWDISRVDPIDRDLALVDAQPLGSELLEVGAVRRIVPEHKGLVHSLYHLDAPSVSLVVRTYGHRDQFSLFRPRIWLNELAISQSDRVRLLGRCIRTAELTRPGTGIDVLKQTAATLDRARWLHLLFSNRQLIDSADALKSVLAVRSDLSSELTDAVGKAHAHAGVVGLIAHARAAITDPDLRFFLALLLNLPSRADLLGLVSRRHPEADPILTCANWIVQLSRFRGDPRERLARIAAAVNVDLRVGVSLREAVGPEVPEDEAIALVRTVLAEASEAGEMPRGALSKHGEKFDLISRRLSELPMLHALLH